MDFFDRIGFFDESLPACEDYDLWLRASVRLPIGLIERPYVVRYGGHSDQRSRQFPVMDQYRVRALCKLLEGGALDDGQRKIVRRELQHKCQIISKGARKRGNIKEAVHYEHLADQAGKKEGLLSFPSFSNILPWILPMKLYIGRHSLF